MVRKALFGAALLAAGTAHAAGQKTVALVPGLTTDPFYITMQRGAAEEAKKLGLNLIWQGGSSFSPELQIPVLQALLAKHPDALLIAPTNDTALINPMKQYVNAKIPVITVDTTITDASILASRITSNNLPSWARFTIGPSTMWPAHAWGSFPSGKRRPRATT